jgi:broad specificity phosphatase PhoE
MDSLLFIRHAETDLAGRFCGHSDPPVNKRGQRQIKDLLRKLEGKSIDAIYTSDLSRAQTTADAIAEVHGASLIVIPGLREISFGDWEGLTWSEIEFRDADYARRWSKAFPGLPAPGGELFAMFQSRVLTEVEKLFSNPKQGCAAVVTHRGVMCVVLRSLCGLDEEQAWAQTKAYCSLFRYPQGGGL